MSPSYSLPILRSTVGYGDISPPDTQSRLVVVVLVGFFFFMIPRELNALNRLLDLSSKYTVRGRDIDTTSIKRKTKKKNI